MDDKDIQSIIDNFTKAYPELAKEMSAYSDELKKLVKAAKVRGISDADLLKHLKLSTESFKKFRNVSIDAAESMITLQNEIEDLEDQIKSTTDTAIKSSLEKQKQDKIEKKNREFVSESFDRFSDSLAVAAGAVIKGFVNSMTGATASALSGSDALDISAGFMKAGVDTANSGIQAVAGGATTFGTTMMATGGRTAKFGIAVAAAGATLGFLSSTISELAKAGIGFMFTQTQKMISGFQQMSTIGAVYSGSMREMVDTALSANMTINQFSKVIDNNREEFVKSGLTVAEGSKRMSKAMQAGGDLMRSRLFALGMSIEEQADATAKTMTLMSGPAGRLKATNEEVAAQTQEYATNLKIISNITGEDAKAKQAAIQQSNDNLFMQQQISAMGETERIKFNEMQQTMNATDLRALSEKMKYGNIISTDLAAASAMSPGIAKKWQEQYDSIKNGTMSTEKGLAIQANMADEIRKNAVSQTAISIATGQQTDAINAITNDQLKFANKHTKEGIKSAEEATKLAQMQTGPGSAADLMALQQRQQIDLQTIASSNLKEFGVVLHNVTEDIRKSVLELSKISVTTGTTLGSMFSTVAGVILPILAAVPGLISLKGAMGAGAGTVASKGLAETGSKGVAKAGAKGLGKSLLKKIPGIGLLAGLGFGASRALAGDWSGAGMEVASGAAGTIPGVGTAASFGIDAALATKDMGAFSKGSSNAGNALLPTNEVVPTTTTPTASTEPSKFNQQLLTELKKMNEHLTMQDKTSIDSIALFRQLLDVNHNQLSVQSKTFHAVS